MSTIKISKHISYKEATHSNTATRRGIKNSPNEKQMEAMKTLAKKIFEPLRKHFGQPIRINSFFRSAALNKAIGGSTTSQHTKGEAIDLDGLNGIKNRQLYDYIKNNLEYDQLIWEFGTDEEPDWIHVSYTTLKPNRNQILRASRKSGKTVYTLVTDNQPTLLKESVKVKPKENLESEGTIENRRGVVKVKTSLNVREKADKKATKLGKLKNETEVIIIKEKKGWFKIKTSKIKGWVSTEYVVII